MSPVLCRGSFLVSFSLVAWFPFGGSGGGVFNAQYIHIPVASLHLVYLIHSRINVDEFSKMDMSGFSLSLSPDSLYEGKEKEKHSLS